MHRREVLQRHVGMVLWLECCRGSSVRWLVSVVWSNSPVCFYSGFLILRDLVDGPIQRGILWVRISLSCGKYSKFFITWKIFSGSFSSQTNAGADRELCMYIFPLIVELALPRHCVRWARQVLGWDTVLVRRFLETETCTFTQQFQLPAHPSIG